jgi:CrcB protein
MGYIYIGVAGSVGAILRFSIGVWLQPSSTIFPYSTLLINLLGCLALAWFAAVSTSLAAISAELKTAISTGLIGSFTTFSTFSVETMGLLQQQLWLFALIYIMVSLMGGIFFAWLGERLGQAAVIKKSKERSE